MEITNDADHSVPVSVNRTIFTLTQALDYATTANSEGWINAGTGAIVFNEICRTDATTGSFNSCFIISGSVELGGPTDPGDANFALSREELGQLDAAEVTFHSEFGEVVSYHLALRERF